MILNLTRPKARPGVFLFLRPEAGPRGFKVNSPVGDPWPKDEKDPEPVFFDGESNLIIFVDSLAVQGNCLWLEPSVSEFHRGSRVWSLLPSILWLSRARV